MTPQEFADWAVHICVALWVIGSFIAMAGLAVAFLCEWWRDFKRAKGGER